MSAKGKKWNPDHPFATFRAHDLAGTRLPRLRRVRRPAKYFTAGCFTFSIAEILTEASRAIRQSA